MIDPKSIHQDIFKIITRLNEKSFEAYVVGGAVRDLLLNRNPKDFDISTNATPRQILSIFPQNATIIGKRFKIVHIQFNKKIYEISTFRRKSNKQKKIGKNRSPNGIVWRDNTWGSLEQDAPRRDFSINALYYNPINNELKDPISGLDDLHNKKIRCLGNATTRFQEDPIRILRALKLVAQYGFYLSSDIITAIKQKKNLLAHISQRRLFEEIMKITQKPYLENMINLMYKYELLYFILPQINTYQIKQYLQLAQQYDINFHKMYYSKPYALALLAYPFIHYHITKNNEWHQYWTLNSQLDKKIIFLIEKFYSPYKIFQYDIITVKEILISTQKIRNGNKKGKNKIKYYFYAKELLATIQPELQSCV